MRGRQEVVGAKDHRAEVCLVALHLEGCQGFRQLVVEVVREPHSTLDERVFELRIV